MATLILVTATELNHEAFVLHMLERLPPQMREVFAEMMNALDETLKKEVPPKIRVHNPDGTWTEVALGTKQTSPPLAAEE